MYNRLMTQQFYSWASTKQKGMYIPPKDMYRNQQSTICYNNQKMETTQIPSVVQWMNSVLFMQGWLQQLPTPTGKLENMMLSENPGTKEHILCDPIYMKTKNGQY